MCVSRRSDEIDHQAVVISARIPSTPGLYSSFGVISLFYADYCQSLTNTANYKINIDKIHLYQKNVYTQVREAIFLFGCGFFYMRNDIMVYINFCKVRSLILDQLN